MTIFNAFHNVMNLVYELPLTHHQRLFAHHMDSCTTLTVALHLRLQFPSSIALTTHTADCIDHTLYINHGLPLLCRVLFSILLVLATYQALPCLCLCSVSCIVLRFFHSQSVSCFTEPFLVSVSYFSFSLVFSCCLVVWFLTFCIVYSINPLPSIWTLFAPAWTIACVPGLPLLSSPLDIVRRSKTMPVYLSTHLPCPQYTCLPFVRPCLCF